MNIRGKNLFAIIITACLLVIFKGVQADAYVGSIFTYTYNNQTLTYKVLSEPTATENGTAAVIDGEGISEKLTGKVEVPREVTNQNMPYDVTRIKMDAFSDAVNITSIKLPDTITYIAAYAFNNCSKLADINIPDGVPGIENGTFYGCSSLKSLHLPDSITDIGRYAFAYSSSLTTINIPEGVKSIGTGAFMDCSNLTSMVIPEGVLSIEEKTFKDCTKLASVILPDSITSIGRYAFYDCSSLKSIHLSDEITSIGEYAFYSCSSLTSIKIPYKVTKIGDRTFFDCSGLKEIRIQDKVTSIGDFAFYNCSSLISLKLPESLEKIGAYTFFRCDNLRPLTIPAGVSEIGPGKAPYTGVWVYKNSYAETYFAKNFPEYYQIVKLPLKEMTFGQEVMNLSSGEKVSFMPVFYLANASGITGSIKWSSSNPQIVTVDKKGSVRGISAGEADVTAVMGKFQAVCHIIVDGEVIEPESIALSEYSLDMQKGESASLSLEFTPAEATNREIMWKSSDNSVVTVDNGNLYAKGPGSAAITAVSASGTAQCQVTVSNPLKEVYTDYDEIKLNKGDTKKINLSFEPFDTTDDRTTVWKSEDESAAVVENGVIKAVKPGTTKITAAAGGFSHSILVTVLSPAESITFSQTSVSLASGQKQALPLTVLPEDTTDEITYTSSDPSVAIYSQGVITAKNRGKAVITAVCGSFTASVEVTVATDIKSITLDKSSFSLYLGRSKTFQVVFNPVLPADDKTITWSSSDKAVVKVDSKGKLQTVGTGTALITATAGGSKKAVSRVTVKLAVPSSMKAVSGGYNRAKITWRAVNGATAYQLYRSTSKNGTYKYVKTTTAKSYTNTGLSTGKTYYYKVRAYRLKGRKKVHGSFTPAAAVKPVPATPGKVKLKKVSTGRISFTWNKVSGASGYEVYRASSKTKTYSKVTTTTSLHYINYGLTKGRTYYYKVRAYKIVGSKKIYGKFTRIYSVKI